MKNSNDTIRNRTCDLLVCSAIIIMICYFKMSVIVTTKQVIQPSNCGAEPYLWSWWSLILQEIRCLVGVLECTGSLQYSQDLATGPLYMSNQRDAVLSRPFIVLQNHTTCFGCPLHPSSGVHKTVVTTTGTSHVYRSGSYLTLAWPNLPMPK